MTVSARHSQNRAAHRHRQALIRAAFVPCPRNVYLRLRGAQVIPSMCPATDRLSNRSARITNVIDDACPIAPLQIPIALGINPATAQRPAVSFPEACPTPAI